METLKNGWTKKRVMNKIEKLNKGICRNEIGDCVYRGPKGNMCLLGVFIPEKVYRKEMENVAADVLIRDYPELGEIVPFSGIDAQTLQALHDEEDDITKKELHAKVREWLDANFV